MTSIERTFEIKITPEEAAGSVIDMDSHEQSLFLATLLRGMSRTDWNRQLACIVDDHRVAPATNHDALEMLGLLGKWGTP
jgi:hypothetical protein